MGCQKLLEKGWVPKIRDSVEVEKDENRFYICKVLRVRFLSTLPNHLGGGQNSNWDQVAR